MRLKRRRKKSSVAIVFSLVMWAIGTAAGILAGYAVLCIVDSKYDYLNLFNNGKPETMSVPMQVDPPKAPEKVQPKISSVPTLKTKPRPVSKPASDQPSPKPAPNTAANNLNVELPPAVVPTGTVFKLPENLPSFVSLPSATAGDEPVALASLLPGTDSKSIELSLIDGGSPQDGSTALVASRAESGAKNWTVSWAQAANATESEPIAVAVFSLENGALSFRWQNTASAPAMSALSNSLLCVSAWGTKHWIALRQPTAIDPNLIDLKSSRTHLLCKCNDPPQPIDALIDITLDDIPSYRLEGHDLVGLKLGDRLTLKYSDVNGVETRISIVGAGSLVSVDVESSFRLPSGGTEDLSNAVIQRRASQLEDRLEKLKAAEEKRHVPFPEQRNAIVGDINAIQKVLEIADRIDGHAKISIRFYHLVGDQPVELMVSE